MAKNKKKPIKDKPFMKTHSRKTGKIILIALACVLIGGGSFFALAFNEANLIQENEERFRALSCDEMKKELLQLSLNDPDYFWKSQAINDKVDCEN